MLQYFLKFLKDVFVDPASNQQHVHPHFSNISGVLKFAQKEADKPTVGPLIEQDGIKEEILKAIKNADITGLSYLDAGSNSLVFDITNKHTLHYDEVLKITPRSKTTIIPNNMSHFCVCPKEIEIAGIVLQIMPKGVPLSSVDVDQMMTLGPLYRAVTEAGYQVDIDPSNVMIPIDSNGELATYDQNGETHYLCVIMDPGLITSLKEKNEYESKVAWVQDIFPFHDASHWQGWQDHIYPSPEKLAEKLDNTNRLNIQEAAQQHTAVSLNNNMSHVNKTLDSMPHSKIER